MTTSEILAMFRAHGFEPSAVTHISGDITIDAPGSGLEVYVGADATGRLNRLRLNSPGVALANEIERRARNDSITVVKATVMPAGIGEMTGDTIVECWDGISDATYKEVWSFVNEAHHTSRAIHAEGEKWMAGRGSNLKGGGDTMNIIWPKLSEDAKRDIIAADRVQLKKEQR